jgi:hypothetical protein
MGRTGHYATARMRRLMGVTPASGGCRSQARVKIYQDAAQGFLFQHHAEFARDVDASLRE